MSVLLLGLQNPTVPTSPELPTLLLTGIVWLPLLVGGVLLLFPARTELERSRVRTGAVGVTGLVLAMALVMWSGFREQGGNFAYEESRAWLSSVGASYHLGVDGVSMPLILLSAILFFAAALAAGRMSDRVREFLFLLLALETGVNGVFAALDFVLLLVFLQLLLVPVFLLIAWWGGPLGRQVAWKTVIFLELASAMLVLAVILMHATGSAHTFDIATLHDSHLPKAASPIVFWLAVAGFGIALPIFPLHTWFLDAVSEAPTSVSVVLAGVISKLGAYGFYRVVLGQFPDLLHRYGGGLAVLALLSILWSALAGFGEDDLKRIIGLSSMSRMGLVLLAVVSAAPIALNGGVLLLFADGLATALLLLLAGTLIERTGTRSVRASGGLAARMPRAAILWFIGALAAIGLPGLVGFAAEFLLFTGAYPALRLATSLAVLGTLLGAGVLVFSAERVFFGPAAERLGRVRDLGTAELSATIMLAAVLVLLGLLPALLVDSINFGILALLARGG